MTGGGYSRATIAELTREDGLAQIRRSLGVSSFGINAWSAAEPGAALVPEHDEDAHEELYIVISGAASFTVGGETFDAPAGTIVFVPDPATVRSAHATAAGTTVLAAGGQPGVAFEPNPWELNRYIVPLFNEQRYAEAKERTLEALAEFPASGTLLYNLACAEAQLGEAEAALTHLSEAVRADAGLAALLADDEDLAPLRERPEFAELAGPGG